MKISFNLGSEVLDVRPNDALNPGKEIRHPGEDSRYSLTKKGI